MHKMFLSVAALVVNNSNKTCY